MGREQAQPKESPMTTVVESTLSLSAEAQVQASYELVRFGPPPPVAVLGYDLDFHENAAKTLVLPRHQGRVRRGVLAACERSRQCLPTGQLLYRRRPRRRPRRQSDGGLRRPRHRHRVLPRRHLSVRSSWSTLGSPARMRGSTGSHALRTTRSSPPPDHRRQRCGSKKSLSRAPHSWASTPRITSGRWFRRRSRSTSHRDPAAPAFGSTAP